MAKKFFTYILRDPTRNNEPFYVGKGTGRRFKVDKNKNVESRKQKIIDSGFSVNIEIINALDEEHSFFLEECLISIFGRRDLETGTLWNFTNGVEGTSGYKHTRESKEKISQRHLGAIRSEETKKNISNSLIGKSRPPMSQAQKDKLSLATKNMSDEHRKKLSLAKIGNKNAKKNKEII